MQPLTIALLAVFGYAVVLACPPPPPAAPAATSAPPARKRRAVESEVEVTLVTNAPFDQTTVSANLQLVKDLIADYKKRAGITSTPAKIRSDVIDKAGRFAVVYNVVADCDNVQQFVKGTKSATDKIAYITVKCSPNAPLLVF